MESQPPAAPPTIVCVAVLLSVVYVFPSIHVKLPQASCTSVPVTKVLIVKSKVTIESQPLAAPPTIVCVAVLLSVVYVFPSIHVKLPQASCTSVPVTKVLIVKSKVTIEYQPLAAPPTIVCVAVLLSVVYVFPSIHVKLPQASCTSVPVTKVLIVKSKVTIESQPLAAPP